MKKLFTIVGLIILTVAFLGCQKQPQEISLEGEESLQEPAVASKEGKIKVVTTIFPQYDFSREIGQDKIQAQMLVKPGSDIHYFEPSPQDVIKIQEADLFIYTGGPDEDWVEDLVLQMEGGPETIRLMDLVEVYEEEIKEGMEHDHDHDHEGEKAHNHDHEGKEAHNHDHEGEEVHDHDHEGKEAHDHDHHHEEDEHIWTSLRNAQKISKAIGEKLIVLDPENANFYKENMAAYTEKLGKLDQDFTDFFRENTVEPMIFGDRFPFRYFVEDYNLDYYAAFPGCSALVEPSAQTLSFLIDKAKDEKVSTIYKIEGSNGQMASTIAEAAGAQVKTFHSAHNLSQEEFDQGLSYYTIMEENLKTLRNE